MLGVILGLGICRTVVASMGDVTTAHEFLVRSSVPVTTLRAASSLAKRSAMYVDSAVALFLFLLTRRFCESVEQLRP